MLPTNLNYLRKAKKNSQQKLADAMGIPRTTLGDYERGKTEPNIEMLIKLADYFEVTIDDMVRKNLSHRDLEIIKNKNMKVLAITVDKDEEENIELVATRAEAGYLENFQDPEFVRDLPKIHLPNIPKGSTYRAFEIQGDSMLPMESGSVVICNYIEQLDNVKNNKTYIIASKNEGLVYKRVILNKKNQQLTLMSDNEIYPPYTIHYEDIAEVWQYYAHLSFSDSKSAINDMLEEKITDIQKKVTILTEQIETSR